MTRINCIPVQELTDNFILVEYFELPRLYPLIAKAIDKKNLDIPESYRYGSGHMRFFYNKVAYLRRRHKALYIEGSNRGLSLGTDPAVDPAYLGWAFFDLVPDDYNHDWEPEEKDLQLNRDRLQYRRKYEGGSYG